MSTFDSRLSQEVAAQLVAGAPLTRGVVQSAYLKVAALEGVTEASDVSEKWIDLVLERWRALPAHALRSGGVTSIAQQLFQVIAK